MQEKIRENVREKRDVRKNKHLFHDVRKIKHLQKSTQSTIQNSAKNAQKTEQGKIGNMPENIDNSTLAAVSAIKRGN